MSKDKRIFDLGERLLILLREVSLSNHGFYRNDKRLIFRLYTDSSNFIIRNSLFDIRYSKFFISIGTLYPVLE
jgi:hypothetical protein